MRLDARAHQDVAILGLEFLKLDTRAREDIEKIDHGVKKKAEHLHHVAMADWQRVDFWAKQRGMEDALMALEGKTLEFFLGNMSTDRITAIQEAYWSMASALSEADRICFTDLEETSLSKCIDSCTINVDSRKCRHGSTPDYSLKQQLAEDGNPAIAAAAPKAINEPKKQ
ncbi:hypothetical protein RJ641_006433 [Dillenia turbinata]|uniref:Uncharacterized protein n=1 Tax=Dillenia turbinata TaxID=194707 RepID=A0AAN8Z7L8_9MAGN